MYKHPIQCVSRITSSYNANRSLREVRDCANRVTSFDYYQNGQLHRIHRPNGTQRKFTYTLAGEIECLAELTADGRVLHVSRFTYDQRGHIAQRQSFPVLPEGMVRTPAMAAVMGPDNELKEVNAQPQTHDLRGNLRAGFLPDGITAADYEFDARNRLTSLAEGSSRYEYDVANTRIRITEGTQTTTFSTAPLGGMSQVMVETRPGSAEGSLVERLYVYTPGGQRLYHLDPDLAEGAEPGAMQATYYHYDLTGSTVTLTGEAGQETGRVHYAAYGEILSRSGNTDTRFLFCGAYGVQTDSSGLLHMRARYYNPYTCRFISEDPIGFEGGLNWYGYANGDPLNLVDPTGWCDQNGGVEGYLTDAVEAFVEGGSGAIIRGAVDNAVDQISPANALGLQGTDFDGPDAHIRPFGTDPNGGEAKLGQIASVIWGVALGANQIAGGTRSGTRTATATHQGSGGSGGVESVQRAMSRAELEAIRNSGVLSRGGRPGPHHVSNSVNSTATRARQRLALPGTPEVRVTLEVPSGTCSPPLTVQPYRIPGTNQVLPGGGLERTAPGNINIPARIINVLNY